MRVLVLGLLLPVSLFANPFKIQQIPNVSDVTSLDTPANGSYTWWVTSTEIDPKEVSEDFLKSTTDVDSPSKDWIAYPAPFNANHIPEVKGAKVFWIQKSFFVKDISHAASLRLGIITDRDVTYLNGEEIGRMGNWDSKIGQAYDRIRFYDIPPSLLRKGNNIILIRSKPIFPDDAGLYRDRTEIGPQAEITRSKYIEDFRSILFLVCYATVGSYFLFLFVRRRKESENLFFSAFIIGWVCYQLLRTQIKYELGIPLLPLKQIEYTILCALVPLFYEFVRRSLELSSNKLVRIVDIVTRLLYLPILGFMVTIAVTNDVTLWNKLNYMLLQPIWVVLVICLLSMLVYRSVKKDADAIAILTGILIFSLSVVIDIMIDRGIINIPRITGFVFFIFILSLAIVLANRFVRLHHEVEDLNRNLERKVESRTAELRTSLEQIQELKTQQDGDYFLVSLLLRPLHGDYAQSKNFHTQILIEQKKKFKFKKWESDIGGDLCNVHTITLKGKEYTLFLNADAMGKSMQGASGALVVGVIFNAFLARTIKTQAGSNRFPERWLRDCFLELQGIFTSFDGSMLVSAILGLVDNETGLVYYINAEHPWITLYRGQEASFIDETLELRKIGFPDMEDNLIVKTFQLEPDDALILGSDGRDDLLLSRKEDGSRTINEDHTEFLRRVKDGQGDLESIRLALLRNGELTDDLSLIRIGFMEDPPANAMSDLQRERVQLQTEIDELLAKRDYASACVPMEKLIEVDPGNTEAIYAYSVILKKLPELRRSSLEKAAELGERIKLREPDHLKNLINLADVYRLLRMPTRAKDLLVLAKQIHPGNSSVDRLEQLLARN